MGFHRATFRRVGRIAELVSVNVPVATNCWVPPTKIEGVAGVTAIEMSGLFTTWIRKSEVPGEIGVATVHRRYHVLAGRKSGGR